MAPASDDFQPESLPVAFPISPGLSSSSQLAPIQDKEIGTHPLAISGSDLPLTFSEFINAKLFSVMSL
jgi:hypothetical protein